MIKYTGPSGPRKISSKQMLHRTISDCENELAEIFRVERAITDLTMLSSSFEDGHKPGDLKNIVSPFKAIWTAPSKPGLSSRRTSAPTLLVSSRRGNDDFGNSGGSADR
jgi:hypothetical protein